MDVNVAGLIADRFEGSFGGPDFEICVRDEAVLCDVEADGYGSRVTVFQLEVDVAEAAVEREFAGVGDGFTGSRALVRVPEHVVVGAALKVAGVGRENKDGAMCTVTDEADACPDVHGVLDGVTSFGNKYHPVMCGFLEVIDGGLKG